MKRVLVIFQSLIIIAFVAVSTSCSSESDLKDNTKNTYVCTPCSSDCDTITYTKDGICKHCNMPLILKEDVSKPIKIAFYLQNGVEILDFAGPMEVFAYAGYEVFTVSKNQQPLITQGILKVIPDYSIDNAPPADILAFFGGNASEAYKDNKVIKWVKSQYNTKYYFSVCTGAFILAESGLLNGKTATTFHNALNDLEYNYPAVKVLKNVRFVDNGNIVTTAGISAGIDGALHLVAKLSGFDIARKTAYYMEYDKWVPGEGLLLSEDNPYKDYSNTEKLKAYVGTYEYQGDAPIELKINENEKSLFAIVDNLKYPIFYIKRDTLSNLNGDRVIFERGVDNMINGFRSSHDKSKFYSKQNK